MDIAATINSAEVPEWPYVYVVGSFDNRITFYSQQVRAFNLAYAFAKIGPARKKRFAVIGAGASGLAMAAGLSLLVPNSVVQIYERAEHPLHLQRGCTKRNLHPHIYDWPKSIAYDSTAGLPFLDWDAGSASDVAKNVTQQFTTLQAYKDRRLELRTLCEVTSLERLGSAYRIHFQPCAGGPPNSASYDAVFITIGFGAERPLPGCVMDSYWEDAGVPGAQRYAAKEVSVMVSGSGDGGLIDLCAAALQDFDHTALIDLVISWPGISCVAEELLQIDREADTSGPGFDFAAAYDRNIGPTLKKDGLIDEIVSRLRQRVEITFNTKRELYLEQPTSTLNRVLVYLLFTAATDAGRPIRHMPGSIAADPASLGSYIIGGLSVKAEELYVRHGVAKLAAFSPFDEIRQLYATSHEKWLSSDPARRSPPRLHEDVIDSIERALALDGIPVSRAAYEGVRALAPARVRFGVDESGVFAWYGDLRSADLLEWWGSPSRTLSVECGASPHTIPSVGAAMARFMIHARQIMVESNDPLWATWLRTLSDRSLHARAIEGPVVVPIAPSALKRHHIESSAFAADLHARMDSWMLDRVDEHITSFLDSGIEPVNWITWIVEPKLRAEMNKRWLIWKAGLRADPPLLSRLFRLAACTVEDDAGDIVDRQVLVGRHRLAPIVRTMTLALAAAGAWPNSSPRAGSPGNFDQRAEDGFEIATIHASGAELIQGKTLTAMASLHHWQTSIVLLSELTSPVQLEAKSEATLMEIEGSDLRMDTVTLTNNLIIGADAAFELALSQGSHAVTSHLNAAESHVQESWASFIDTGA